MQFRSSDGWGLFDVNGPDSTTPCGASTKLWSQAKVPSRSLKVCKTQPAAIASRSKCRSISSTASGRGPPARRSPFAKLPYTAVVYKSACREGGREKPISKHHSIWRAAVGLHTTPCALQDRWERRQAGTRSGNEERIGICRNPGSTPTDLFSLPWSFQDSLSQHWQHEQVTAPGRPRILRCNHYPGNQNKRGGNTCYCKHY